MKGKLGFAELFAIGVGGMIGGGIFAVLGLSLQLSDGAAFLSFLLAGMIALATAYSYAVLSRRFPSQGGTVEFIVQAYGDTILAGGLNLLLLLAYVVMIALYTHAFASYGAAAVGGGRLVYDALAILVVGLFTLVNALGAKTSGRVELGLVGFKLGVLLLAVAAGLEIMDWHRLSPAHWPGPVAIIAGGMVIFLAYEGFELISNAAADASSTRDLVRAFYASVLVVIAVYVAIAIVSSGTLTPQQVVEARDYALALVVEPVLGLAGFYLIVAAALASTASAINATLYGTARISYMLAKYGMVPEGLERRVWREAPEGLIIIALLSLLLALLVGLDAISTAGSGAFLLVFAMVNYAAYKLREKTKANPTVTITATIATIASLAVLLYRMATENPNTILLFAAILAGSFVVEYAYRQATGRRLPRYVDPKLAEREKLKTEWHAWLPRLAEEIRKVIADAEVYLVGGIARGELESSHDVDILVVTSKAKHPEVYMKIKRAAEKAGITTIHPVDIHVATHEEKHKHLEKSRAYKRLA